MSRIYSIGRVMSLGLGIGILLNLPWILPDCYSHFYRAAAFDRVEVGMSFRDTTEILQHAGVWCGVTAVSSSTECYFSDIGRNYLIRLDAKEGRVIEKTVTLRHHRGIRGWVQP
jgi:hypothetical protein